MQLEMSALCEAATDTYGKLSMLGAFDTIVAQKFPVVFPHCAVVLRVRFARVEEGEHPVRVSFVDDDGHPLVPPLDAKLKVRVPGGQPTVAANLILNLQGLKVEKAGGYSIDIAVDGRQEISLPLMVRQAPPRGGGAGGGPSVN